MVAAKTDPNSLDSSKDRLGEPNSCPIHLVKIKIKIKKTKKQKQKRRQDEVENDDDEDFKVFE